MTIRQTITDRLISCGLMPDDAAKVMDDVIAAEENAPMQGRWDDEATGYPPSILSLAWFSAKQHALAWIDANCPQAWFRGMFTEDAA